jgi:hypothetical protein
MMQDSPKFKYVITAMDGSKPAGTGEVVQASQRTYDEQLDGGRTASLAVNTDNPRVQYALDNDALLKVYRRDRAGTWHHRLTGDIISTEEKSDGSTSQVTITAWRLGKRFIGMAVNSAGQGIGFTVGTVITPVDLATAIAQVLTSVNNDFYSGIQQGTITLCGTVDVVGPVYAAFAGPTIQQICATLGGPDFWIDPEEPSGVMPNVTVGQLNVGPIRGINRPLAIFEFGTGKKNVQSCDRLLSKQNVCNNAAALPTGWPTAVANGDTVQYASDSGSQGNISRFDDIASSDVSSAQLRQAIAQEEVAVRKQKQQVITFVPTVDNPIDFTLDYDVGDIVTARAYDESTKRYRYNGTARVYGVSLTVDDSDAETISLTLTPGG